MKKGFRAVLGVTLLEVMLVLAIAAMIIVMSIRYYQSSNTSQQANTILSTITAIVSAADGLGQAQGTYVGTVTTTNVTSVVGSSAMSTPWQTNVSVTGKTATTYQITFPATPEGVCRLVTAKLLADPHFTTTAPTTCATGAPTNFVVTYDSTAT